MAFWVRTTFKVTYVDYVILLAAMLVFLHAFFTIEFVLIPDKLTPWGDPVYGMKFGVQIIIAPIIILHRFFIILKGPEITRLRYVDKTLVKALFWAKIYDKLDEGKREYIEWRKGRR
jgi:hypothetical protein